MYLKFWSFIYRRTGYIHPSIKAKQYRYLMENLLQVEQSYKEQLELEDGLDLGTIVAIKISELDIQMELYNDIRYVVWG